MAPDHFKRVIEAVKARDCDAPSVPQPGAFDLELAILELLRQAERDRLAFYAPRGAVGD